LNDLGSRSQHYNKLERPVINESDGNCHLRTHVAADHGVYVNNYSASLCCPSQLDFNETIEERKIEC